jgi:hypothetical protein
MLLNTTLKCLQYRAYEPCKCFISKRSVNGQRLVEDSGSQGGVKGEKAKRTKEAAAHVPGNTMTRAHDGRQEKRIIRD